MARVDRDWRGPSYRCYSREVKEMKIVGRSGEVENSPKAANQWLSTLAQLRGEMGICPKGIYRFRTFEEADQWMNEMLQKIALESRR